MTHLCEACISARLRRLEGSIARWGLKLTASQHLRHSGGASAAVWRHAPQQRRCLAPLGLQVQADPHWPGAGPSFCVAPQAVSSISTRPVQNLAALCGVAPDAWHLSACRFMQNQQCLGCMQRSLHAFRSCTCMHICQCLGHVQRIPHDSFGCRCTQIHQCLGRMQRFQDYYHSNRRLQLISDLTPPQQFMENYQNFTAQVKLEGSSCCS